MINKFLKVSVVLFLTSFLISSCGSFTKRQYRKGYHIKFVKPKRRLSSEVRDTLDSKVNLTVKTSVLQILNHNVIKKLDSVWVYEGLNSISFSKESNLTEKLGNRVIKKRTSFLSSSKPSIQNLHGKRNRNYLKFERASGESVDQSSELGKEYQKWLAQILLTGVLIFMLTGGFYGYLVLVAFFVPVWVSFVAISMIFIGTAFGFAFLWKGKPKTKNGFWKYFVLWLTAFTLILILSILYLALTFSVGGGGMWG